MKIKTEQIKATWNPVTGCTLDQVTLHPDRLEEPLGWKEPRRIFVCGMGDLFNTDVPDKFIIDCLSAMAEAWWHTFILSTKHPRRMRKIFTHPTIANDVWLQTTRGVDAEPSPWPLPNIWLGVQVENQATADKLIPILLQTPAVVRFASMEPMLGQINLERYINPVCKQCGGSMSCPANSENFNDGGISCPRCLENQGKDPDALNWVVCGGKTGPGARPMHPDWVRSLRDQCQAAEVPFFFKQWGEWCYVDQMSRDTYVMVDKANNLAGHGDYEEPWKVGRKAAGRLLDGQEWNEYPKEGAQ